MQSWIFSIITPVSHDPLEIILICGSGAQETFFLLSLLKIENITFLKDSLIKLYNLFIFLQSLYFESI